MFMHERCLAKQGTVQSTMHVVPRYLLARPSQAVRAAGLTENEYLASFGINISPRLKKVQARLLPAPAVSTEGTGLKA